MSQRFRNVSNKSLPPVVAICGATGTGKSKLAVDLSHIFNGEVINADAIQLHRGLDIATNKVLVDETKGIRHHLLGCLSTTEAAAFNIHAYRELCLPLIEQLRTQGKLPILAGGTCYYLEATLWLDFLYSSPLSGNRRSDLDNESISLPSSPSECYSLLQSLDSASASRLHPRDTRKVGNALIEAIRRQRLSADWPNGDSGTDRRAHLSVNRPCLPRYPDAVLLLWLDCKLAVLDGYLDRRVDKMLEAGLIEELEAFVERHMVDTRSLEEPSNEEGDQRSSTLDRLFTALSPPDDPLAQRGILQAIGFKEFANYLAILPADRGTKEAQKLFQESVLAVKSATRRYARRQRKWITNRFLRRPQQGSIPVYRLDVTRLVESTTPDSSQSQADVWAHDVLAPATRLLYNLVAMTTDPVDDLGHAPDELLQSFLNLCPPERCPPALETREPSPGDRHFEGEHVCTVCSRTLYGDADWTAHQKSRRHQRRAARVTADLEQRVSCGV